MQNPTRMRSENADFLQKNEKMGQRSVPEQAKSWQSMRKKQYTPGIRQIVSEMPPLGGMESERPHGSTHLVHSFVRGTMAAPRRRGRQIQCGRSWFGEAGGVVFGYG